ncbi:MULTISPECIES: PotD/PotF family extracellular solute-binding protein [Alphaproteobacteria]|jgi:spermidine/putrescine transport system substrate-binding protein|nr:MULTISPECIES: spermidine/putrescine ABC transporter substrate-binding protein [Alphaproteobacteria]MBP6636093.1 spermidine/putrescine ABC transporter substrate-binding protein [Sulfuritalea sp.]MBP7339177.1 spermidine/putrescine ABC transporter substrate-binding protein [Niveispirillum sp.]MCC6518869.1 spermidine/putrescine ABC transporter substrate-binding protein [Tabrizicola sp.]
MKNVQNVSPCLMAIAVSAGLATPAAAEGSLSLYNWGDYISPDVIDKFGKEFNVAVTLDTYSTNEEMLARIQAGATGYDLIWPSVHMHDTMQKLGLLQETGVNKMPGFENIDPGALRSKEDPAADYCLPYAWGAVGILYNKTAIPELTSWQQFFDYGAANPGKIAMLDDLRETLGVGLIMTGASVNSANPDEIAKAEEFILAQKPNIGAFAYDVIPLVTSGDMAAAHYYVGAVLNVNQNPDLLGFVVPQEGATMYQEDICLLASAPNRDNALKFLEFMMRPDVSAMNTERLTNGSVNLKAIELLPVELKNNPSINPPPETRAKLQIFEDLGKALRVYTRAWDRVKTN